MNLPLFFQRLTKPAGIWPTAAVRPALVATAVIAGYATFMSLTAGQAPSQTAGEQPQWVGQFERPVAENAAPSAPATSASYILPDAVATGTSSKKTSTLSAVTPKVASKTVMPPRRPEDANKVAALAPASVTSQPVLAAPAGPIPPASIQTEAAGPAPRSQNLLSRVTDRLPDRSAMLKPLGVVGDAVHNLIKFF